MLDYYRAVCLHDLGKEEEAKNAVEAAEAVDPYCCFPNRLEDITVLQMAAKLQPELPKAYYYIGNLWYDKRQYEKAKALLEKALVYPENLGEGKLEGTKDNHIHYYLGLAEKALGNVDRARELFTIASTGTDEPAGMMFYNDQPADMIMFQGMALRELGQMIASNSRFYKLISYGEAHIYDEVKMDYFAVSYPDLLIFKEDFTRKNRAHCCFLMGLGNMGVGNKEKAKEYLKETLQLDPHHQKAKLYLRSIAE